MFSSKTFRDDITVAEDATAAKELIDKCAGS
jgi:hypothetical protein